MITLEEMQTYAFQYEMAGVHGKGKSKSLMAYVKNSKTTYEVQNVVDGSKKVVFATANLAEAVDKYNSI